MVRLQSGLLRKSKTQRCLEPSRSPTGLTARRARRCRPVQVQIQELEALKPALLSDGYCGLVRVTDEDLLSQPAGGGSRSMAGGTGAAGGAASAGASPSASEQQEARPVTPPGGASPSASPVKLVLQQLAAAGAGGGGASAQHLAQRGAELLAAGDAQQARHFLQVRAHAGCVGVPLVEEERWLQAIGVAAMHCAPLCTQPIVAEAEAASLMPPRCTAGRTAVLPAEQH